MFKRASKRIGASVLVAAVVGGSRASAIDLSRDTVPGKWVAPLKLEPLPAQKYPEFFDTFDKFKRQVWTGRYKLALQTLRSVKPTDKGYDAADLAVFTSQAMAAQGLCGGAIDAAEGEQPKLVIQRVLVVEQAGDPAAAIDTLRSLLRAHPESVRGHYELGRIAETVDDFKTARDAYAWFVAPPQDYLNKWKAEGEKLFRSAEDAVTVGKAIDRWATLNEQYKADDSLHQTVLDVFVKAYDIIDRQYWPAHVAAARFYVSHDDSKNALQELRQALQVNPQSGEALALLGEIKVGQYDFDTTDSVVAAIRRVNPDAADADAIEAKNLLAQRQPKQAATVVRRMLARLPKSLDALSLLAATEALQLHEEETKKLLADVDALYPGDANAYMEVAQQLSAMRQYPRSAAMYKTAIERAPWFAEARNGLGLLYTQSGDEDDARVTLNAAHELDPFNVETTNYLRLLDTLHNYARKETDHFIVVYDKLADPLIPEYFNDYLEGVYKDVTTDFDFEPKVKTIIEVFPTHDAFSVRTSGAPWIPTVGASTGRIIALVTPRRGENTWKAFNWAQTLRHEFTHTVTLGATDNRISHWMTEGLAVSEEKTGLYWDWVGMMYHASTHDELFNMDDLTFAFWRPKKSSDRAAAYAQSFWVCSYIEQTYGHEAILNMLREFRAGGLQEDVFPKILGRSVGQFFTEFSGWTKQQVATWGYDPKSVEIYDSLREKGDSQIASKHFAEAVATWEEIAKLRPMDQLPHTRLAGLYWKAVDHPMKAIEHFKILHLKTQNDDRYAKVISQIYRDNGDFKNAAAWGLQAIYMDPYEMGGHRLLLQACEKDGDTAGAERERRVIPELQEWLDAQKKKQSQ